MTTNIARYVCANVGCGEDGKLRCKKCQLVCYCGVSCQREHWTSHKLDCNSPLLKSTWRPQWEAEGRKPAFMTSDAPARSFNHHKEYLWGNMPAFDVLKLEANEGKGYKGDLDLLFAASGDLRNVLRTLADLPNDFCTRVSVVVNDRDFNIVARNIIMLLLLLMDDDPQRAADHIIHIWYSAFITEELSRTLQGQILKLVEGVCHETTLKQPDDLFPKTFSFTRGRVRLVLTKRSWDALQSILKPRNLTLQKAQDVRRAVTLAPSRADYRERAFFRQDPSSRFGSFRFRSDGILLPFGLPRKAFSTPNPTLFTDLGAWPMMDSAEPLHGWSLQEVSQASGAAANDVLGKLYYSLLDLIRSVHGRLGHVNISFHLCSLDAAALPQHLDVMRFDRIETSNIADTPYLGPERCVSLLGTLLKEPQTNPHATLITLFMNAVPETVTKRDEYASLREELSHVTKYLTPSFSIAPYDADRLRIDSCRDMVRNNDKFFDRYMNACRFNEFSSRLKLEMKSHHTIIDKWALRIRKRPNQAGAQEEFLRIMGSGHEGCERYVEWRVGG
ncbi:MYND finger family protein [Metarhizium brunneum]